MGWVRVMRVRVGLSTSTQNPRAGQRSRPEPNPFAGSGWVGFGLARVLAQSIDRTGEAGLGPQYRESRQASSL